MVKELKKLKWPRFKGEPQWVRCFAQILNLIVQAILRPFGTPKTNRTSVASDRSGFDSDESNGEDEIEDAENQIRL
jgi:hypothetical protein